VSVTIENDVLVLDVSMNDPLRMKERETVRDLTEEGTDFEGRQSVGFSFHSVEEILTNSEARHDEEVELSVFEEVENGADWDEGGKEDDQLKFRDARSRA